MDSMISDILPEEQRRWLLCKGVTICNKDYKKGKRTRKLSGWEKLKISPYLSVFGRNLQKKVYSILTKLVDGRQVQILTFSVLQDLGLLFQ